MKKKLTLWAALCMVFVCLMSMTAAAAGTATIGQCTISGGNQITVVAAANGVASGVTNVTVGALGATAQKSALPLIEF